MQCIARIGDPAEEFVLAILFLLNGGILGGGHFSVRRAHTRSVVVSNQSCIRGWLERNK